MKRREARSDPERGPNADLKLPRAASSPLRSDVGLEPPRASRWRACAGVGHQEAGGGVLVGGHVVGLQRIEEATGDPLAGSSISAIGQAVDVHRPEAASEPVALQSTAQVFAASAASDAPDIFRATVGPRRRLAQPRPSASRAQRPRPNAEAGRCGTNDHVAHVAPHRSACCATVAPHSVSVISCRSPSVRARRETSYPHCKDLHFSSGTQVHEKTNDEPCQAQCARATIFPRWYVRQS